MIRCRDIGQGLLHLVFPSICSSCNEDIPSHGPRLCIRCVAGISETGFEKFAGNPVEKIFYGRLPLHAAFAAFYFNKGSVIQNCMHRLKYAGDLQLGQMLGNMMGNLLMDNPRFKADVLIPVPLSLRKLKTRGYNQAEVLCEGISRATGLPIDNSSLGRPQSGSSQTKMSRTERWLNTKGQSSNRNRDALTSRHVLLVDDVVTTGATLESCGSALLSAGVASISIATLCYAAH